MKLTTREKWMVSTVSFRSNGAASALCFKTRRAISIKIAKWTTPPLFVTCAKCKKLLKPKGDDE